MQNNPFVWKNLWEMLRGGEKKEAANFVRAYALRFLDAPCGKKKGPFPKLIYKIKETKQFLMKDFYFSEFHWSILSC